MSIYNGINKYGKFIVYLYATMFISKLKHCYVVHAYVDVFIIHILIMLLNTETCPKAQVK